MMLPKYTAHVQPLDGHSSGCHLVHLMIYESSITIHCYQFACENMGRVSHRFTYMTQRAMEVATALVCDESAAPARQALPVTNNLQSDRYHGNFHRVSQLLNYNLIDKPYLM